jgi:hypothetical protein
MLQEIENHFGVVMGIGAAVGTNNYRRKKFNTHLNRTDPYLKSIYSDIVEYDPHAVPKLKPEKLKVYKGQIIKHLRKRYGPNFVEKVMTTFDF